MKLSNNAKRAIYIGSLCSISYLAVYVARNVLGSVTPQMLSDGYTEAFIGTVSSVYLICYAIGQLINGAIGDKIHAKWMIFMGLLGAAVTNIVFAAFTTYQSPFAATVAYGCTGFFLSMIYGPMTKVVSENTEPMHATRCSLGYTLASFLGSPAAGLLATFLAWQSTFTVSSSLLLTMSVAVFVFFTVFERRGIVKYGQYKAEKKGSGNIKDLKNPFSHWSNY